MRLPRLTRKRLVILLVGIIVGLPLLALLLLTIVILIVFSSDDFGLPSSQDCMGVPIEVSGTVHNDAGEPVSDAVVKVMSFHGGEFSFQSDELGQFKYDDPNRLFVYVCDPIFLGVKASGFEAARISYELLDHYTESQITWNKPNQIYVEIVLERSN